jgi:hypothetical protein
MILPGCSKTNVFGSLPILFAFHALQTKSCRLTAAPLEDLSMLGKGLQMEQGLWLPVPSTNRSAVYCSLTFLSTQTVGRGLLRGNNGSL